MSVHTTALSAGTITAIGACGPGRSTNVGGGRNYVCFMGCCHIQERCRDKTKSRQEMFGLSLVCNNEKSIIDMYEPAGRQFLTFWLLEREDMATRAGSQVSQCVAILTRNGK